MHRYSSKGLIKTDNFFWSDWWKYSDITQQSHDMVQPAAVVIVGTPSTGVASCVQCSWSQVSLLSCYSWRPSGMLLCLDTYRDTYCIKWLIHIIQHSSSNALVDYPVLMWLISEFWISIYCVTGRKNDHLLWIAARPASDDQVWLL